MKRVKMRQVEAVDELAKDFGGSDPTDRVTDTIDGPVRTMMVPLGMRRVTSRSRYSTRRVPLDFGVVEKIERTPTEN